MFLKADIRPQFALFAWSIQSLPLSPASPINTPPAPPACHGVYGGVPRRGGGERRVRVIANVVCIVRLAATELFRGLGSRGLAPSTPFTARLARPRATTRVRDMQRAPASGRRPKDYGFLSAAKLAAAVVLCSASERPARAARGPPLLPLRPPQEGRVMFFLLRHRGKLRAARFSCLDFATNFSSF